MDYSEVVEHEDITGIQPDVLCAVTVSLANLRKLLFRKLRAIAPEAVIRPFAVRQLSEHRMAVEPRAVSVQQRVEEELAVDWMVMEDWTPKRVAKSSAI